MVQIYRNQWRRGLFSSLLGYVRDSVVMSLPIKHLPRFLVRLLYGVEPKFAFLVHPRFYQDVFISAPFLEFLKVFFRREKAFKIASLTAPFVLNSVITPHGIDGFVMAQLTLPEIMFEKRKETLKKLEKMISFMGKIGMPKSVIGLGGWFPMISRRGSSLEDFGRQLDLTVTNGHCGTLASIYMMIEKIAEIGRIDFLDLRLGIIGVGKMGANVAKIFNGKIGRIVLIDINEGNLLKTKQVLERAGNNVTEIEVYCSGKETKSIRDVLKDCHIGVSATSSFRNILKLKDLPIGFIAIDDSRPEALPRDLRKERIILEGGMLKIQGAKINYNYGMGQDDNVFGCLGEAFLVALDNQRNLKPTLGDVDLDNFFKLLDLAKKSGVVEGDFKSSDMLIANDDILNAIKKRNLGKTVFN